MTVMPRQERRTGVLETPLGQDVLAIVRFDGAEGINELFEWRLEALSAQGDIDFDALIGKHATLTINSVNGRKRKFDGIVTETQWLGVRDHFHAYRLVLRPWFWVLSQRTDSFIFHDKSVTDIIAAVFARHGALADFDDRTSAAYPPIEYCVQYRESDMAFVTRLMEEFGISFSFVHSDGAHKLIMSDQNSQLDAVEGASRKFIALSGQDRRTEECIHQLVPGRRFASGKATWKDYNFKKPTAEMLAEKEGTAAYEQAGKELYDWPGRYAELGQGQTFAQLKLEAHEALDKRCMAAGNSPSLHAGGLVTLEQHPSAARNTEYLILRSQHTFVSQSYRSGGGQGGEDSYEGQYELLDSAIPLRPVKLTAKPVVQGPQTAFVVGKAGEEIDCDEYGRILVRFHWDRESDQSMRCRVAQNWAYKQWGGMIIPRIGMEVMVEFLDGDPDRPLVTGSVYNGDAMPKYTLPANKTRSTWRSNSHKSSGFNEITFEDKTSGENVFHHAQKDHTTRVRNTRTARVDKHDVYSVGGNRSVEVSGNQKHEVGKSLNLVVGGTGGGAMGALAGVAGLAASTAGLLQQAGAIAGGGGAALGGFAATIASTALGFFTGGGLKSRGGVVGGADPGEDAGTALAESGQGTGDATGGLIPLPGVMNAIIGMFKSESVGVASVEQIGMSKVVNVGATSMENVGKFKKITVGDEFVIEVGASKFIMRKDGTVIILGTNFNFTASGPVQMNGEVVDLNKPGS